MRGRDRYSEAPIGPQAKLLSRGNGHREGEVGRLRAVQGSCDLVQDRKDVPNRLQSFRRWSIALMFGNLLSIPWKPEASTMPLADFPKLSRVAALAATVAKF